MSKNNDSIAQINALNDGKNPNKAVSDVQRKHLYEKKQSLLLNYLEDSLDSILGSDTLVLSIGGANNEIKPWINNPQLNPPFTSNPNFGRVTIINFDPLLDEKAMVEHLGNKTIINLPYRFNEKYMPDVCYMVVHTLVDSMLKNGKKVVYMNHTSPTSISPISDQITKDLIMFSALLNDKSENFVAIGSYFGVSPVIIYNKKFLAECNKDLKTIEKEFVEQFNNFTSDLWGSGSETKNPERCQEIEEKYKFGKIFPNLSAVKHEDVFLKDTAVSKPTSRSLSANHQINI